MNLPAGLHAIASVAFDRLLYCLAEGTLLAVASWLVLRLGPKKTSQTRFAVWFSALLATALLPLLGLEWRPASMNPAEAWHVVTLPRSLAEYLFLGWAIVASVGMLRVVAGVWQLRKLRRSCVPLEMSRLGPEPAALLEEFRRLRPVALLTSERVHVPTAIGFSRPAIILPEWLATEGSADELKHVLLHEMAHLRRRDDWTNLLQQVLKAALFFHPVVWWMERELALHRELACDDAVLSQTLSPREYAQSLARVAERGFLRRQIALAQAAVSRVKQLTLRVTRILDPDRPKQPRFWKPAVPAVAVLAVLSGLSASWVPGLVSLQDAGSLSARSSAVQSAPELSNASRGEDAPLIPASGSATSGVAAVAASEPVNVASNPAAAMGAHAWNLDMKQPESAKRTGASPYVPAKLLERSQPAANRGPANAPSKHAPAPALAARYTAAVVRDEAPHKTNASAAGIGTEEKTSFVLLIATEQTVTAGPDGVQVSVTQVRFLIPVAQAQKPALKKT